MFFIRLPVRISARAYVVQPYSSHWYPTSNLHNSNISLIHSAVSLHMPVDAKNKEQQKKFKSYLERADKNTVLKQLPHLHDEAFQKIDCLQCAACCKNYSPRFKTPDVKRISKHLGLKESVFIETYLNVDEEGDFVVKSTPCPFLGSNNYCTIYDVRPSDCTRFPYTDEDVFIKRQKLTLKNASFCPIVVHVLDRLTSLQP